MIVTPVYDEEGKHYEAGGKRLTSAGDVCDALLPDPFAGVPLDTLRAAAAKGTGVHAIAMGMALAKMAGKDWVTTSAPAMPLDYPGEPAEWADAMGKGIIALIGFFERYQVEPIAVEQPAMSTALGFAGQPDLHCRLLHYGRMTEAVVDFKRVASITAHHFLKLHAYGLLDGLRKAGLFIGWVKPDGQTMHGFQLLHVKRNPREEAALAAAAIVSQWRNNNRGKL